MDEGINKVLVFGSQLVAVILVLTGAYLQQSQLESARPPGTGGQVSDPATGTRYARLWEDPLANYQSIAPKQEVTATVPTRPAPVSDAGVPLQPESPVQMQMQMQRQMLGSGNVRASSERISDPDSYDLILWNVVDERPNPEAIESRIRARYAIISYLATVGYQPLLDSLLAEIALPDPAGGESGKSILAGYSDPFILPPDSPDRNPIHPRRVYVCWSPQQLNRSEGAFDTIAKVRQAVGNARIPEALKLQDNRKIVVLHHGSSDRFKSFLQNPDWNAGAEAHPGDQVLFVKATIPPDPSWLTPPVPFPALQAVVNDDKLVERLAGELKLRIPALHLSGPGEARSEKKSRIVIFTESDGAYGHNLARLFDKHMKDDAQIEVYSYLRGLDGLAENQKSKSTPASSGPKPAAASTTRDSRNREDGFGTSQYDYLRRLASKLKANRHTGTEIVAVGVLGSDVYDKILVLQAVQPELPSVVFFTTDLDSVFLNKNHVSFARNLVISSGEGLDFPTTSNGGPSGARTRWELPPMRDCYQVALVRAVQGVLDAGPAVKWSLSGEKGAGIWEVGAGTHLHLMKPKDGAGEPLLKLVAQPLFTPIVFLLGLINAVGILAAVSARRPSSGMKRDRLNPGAHTFLAIQLISAGTILIVLSGLIAASILPDPRVLGYICLVVALVTLLASGMRMGRLKRLELAGVGIALLLSLLGLAMLATHDRMLFEEPLGVISGTGIWPSIALRMAAFLVGMLLLAFTSRIYHEQAGHITDDFKGILQLPVVDSGKDRITRVMRVYDSLIPPLVRAMRRIKLRRKPDPRMDAADQSAAVTIGSCIADCFEPSRRFRRVVFASAIYFMISIILFFIWKPTVPGRGGMTFLVEKITLSVSVGLYIIHLCYCVELHLCAYEFIVKLTQALPARISQMSEADLDGLGLREITTGAGSLTRVVGMTLLYPLTILSLILLSRLRVFDDWTMTPSLVLTLLFGVWVLVTVSVMMVVAIHRYRLQVEDAVDNKIAQLDENVAEQREMDAPTAEDREAIQKEGRRKHLQAERDTVMKFGEGAFAPWYRQPIFSAILAGLAVIGSLGFADPLISLFVG